MSTLTQQTTAVTGATITAAVWNNEFSNILNDYNGGITNANISASAAIAYSKLNLTGAILNADLAGSIAATKISNTAATLTDTQTLTNKRITKRVGTTASSATPTPASDDVDIYTVTALAVAATFGAPTGTPTNGQGLIIRIKDDGSARSLSFNASYRFSTDLPAPTTTTVSKTMYLGFLYNSADSVWDCLSILDNL